jgi:hypothetical protein
MRRGSESTITNGSISGHSDVLVEEDETKEDEASVKEDADDDDETPTPTGASPAVARSPGGSAAPSVSTEKSSSHKR